MCRGIALQSADPGVGQGGQAETLQRCIESEKEVREQLKKRWGEFSAADKRHCVTLAKTGGESSNTELLTCLEMARECTSSKVDSRGAFRAHQTGFLAFDTDRACDADRSCGARRATGI